MFSLSSPQERPSTHGERLVAALLNKLPKDEYFFAAEPRLVDRDEREWQPDFVLVCRKMGVVVIEVKDWVEVISVNAKQVRVRRRDGEKETHPNPVITCKNYAHALADFFEKRDELHHKHRGKRKLKFPWHHLVILANIDSATVEQLAPNAVWAKGTVIGRGEITNETKFAHVLKEINWHFNLQRPIDNATLNVLREVLDPPLIVEDEDGRPRGTVTIPQANLIREPIKMPAAQMSLPFDSDDLPAEVSQLVDNFTVRLVRGVAGSGKSLVLIRRAAYLAQQHPNARICVLTFNKDLAHNLQQKLNTPAVEVVNFHKKCTEIIGPKWKSPTQVEHWLEKNAAHEIADAGLTVDFVAREIGWRKDVGLLDNNLYLTANRRGRGTSLPVSKRMVINTIFARYQQVQRASFQANRSMLGADWEDVPHFAAGELSTADHPLKAAYDVIMLDEAQDFAPSWMTVIKLMLKPEGTLFICDDPTQSIFRYFSWAEKGINVVGRTRVLRIPFRNTRSIAYAAHALIEADPNLSNSEDIIRPNLDSTEVPDGVAPALLKCRDLTEEVRLTEAQIRQHLDAGVTAGEIAVLIHNKRLVKHWVHLRNRGCYVETFDKMKGLEFRVVFVPHLQTAFEAGSMPTDTEFISTVRRRIFTAMTRARESLILSYQGQCPAALDPLKPYVREAL